MAPLYKFQVCPWAPKVRITRAFETPLSMVGTELVLEDLEDPVYRSSESECSEWSMRLSSSHQSYGQTVAIVALQTLVQFFQTKLADPSTYDAALERLLNQNWSGSSAESTTQRLLDICTQRLSAMQYPVRA